MANQVPRTVGAHIFGTRPEDFDRWRLRYPPEIYAVLRSRCGLSKSSRVFEVGPGTGIATRGLLEAGVRKMTLVESDARLARYVARHVTLPQTEVTVLNASFERASLPPGCFDLGVAASSFHWVAEPIGLKKVARALRPGGWWAEWGNRHSDPFRPHRFSDAIDPLYRTVLKRKSGVPQREELEEQRARRIAALREMGSFDHVSARFFHWSVRLTPVEIAGLWGSFSDILILHPALRRRFLRELRSVVAREFGDEVNLRVLTPLYTARRIPEVPVRGRAAPPGRARRPGRTSVSCSA